MNIVNYTKEFALTNKVGSRLNTRGLLFYERHDNFLVIFTEDKTNKVKKKFIKAQTESDAEDQFRKGLGGVLNKDYTKPNNVRAFKMPKDRREADAYYLKLTNQYKKSNEKNLIKNQGNGNN